MKARMKDNLVARYSLLMPDEIDDETIEFLDSIDGKVVDLTFTCGDAFEKNNNNIWLPDELWTKIRD